MRWIITKDVSKERKASGISWRGYGNYTLNPDDLPLNFRTVDAGGNIDFCGRADEEGYALLRCSEDDRGDAQIQFAGKDGIYRTL